MGIFNSDIKASLKKEFIKSIKSNFHRKTIVSPSRWAEKYRVIKGKPWKFNGFPWLKGMHDSDADFNVGQKGAQLGFTEAVLDISFYQIDVNCRDVLYLLPSRTPDASDFSASRFDPAVEESDYLSNLFSDRRNIGHKRAGSANFYIRGARSRANLKSIPVGVLIMDEINEYPRENIPLALERLSGQQQKLIWMVSTPTIEDHGISIYYKQSSQNIFYFKCPSCSRYVDLSFPESLVIIGESSEDPRVKESHLICKLCKNTIHHEEKIGIFESSQWISTYTDRDTAGWHISQLYATVPVCHPSEIAKAYFYSLADASYAQEFYNSKLGINHESEGARITDKNFETIQGNYTQIYTNDYGSLVTLGVDVGYPYIHYELDEWTLPRYMTSEDLNLMSRPRILNYGKVKDFAELDKLMHDFKVRFAVIDAHPERRKAYEFAMRFYGRVRLAFYGNGITGKQIHISDLEEATLTVDRTSWLDLSLGRFRNNSITTPADTNFEYKEHLKAPVRIYKNDRNGNPVGTYVNSKADHYAHARNYAEIALPLAVSIAASQTISSNVL